MKSRRKNFRLDGIFSSPLVLWAVSIIIAVMMWVYVTGMEEAEPMTRKFSCAVEYRGLDANAILRKPLSEVDIEISGSEAAITQLDYNSVKAFVDARNLLPGKRYTASVFVECPQGVSLLSVFPSQVTLDIVRQVSRLFPVQTVLPPNIPEGLYIDNAEIIPREVGVRGAEDDIAKVGSVRISPSLIDLQYASDLLLPVKFSQSEPFEGSVAIEPPQVRFRGSLARGLPRKRVPVNVRLAGRLDRDYEIKSIAVDPSEVLIEGKSSLIAGIDAVDTRVIDVSLASADRVIIAPLLPPSQDIALPASTSVKVSIHLTEIRAEKMFSHIPVDIRPSDAPAKFTSSPMSVTVTVEGRPSLIESFDPLSAGLGAYVDMTNIFIFPAVLPVATVIASPDIFRVVQVEPQNVTVQRKE